MAPVLIWQLCVGGPVHARLFEEQYKRVQPIKTGFIKTMRTVSPCLAWASSGLVLGVTGGKIFVQNLFCDGFCSWDLWFATVFFLNNLIVN